ncbi:MAG: hypothetical protein SGPRY_006787, partial [Prymnesium sp.]
VEPLEVPLRAHNKRRLKTTRSCCLLLVQPLPLWQVDGDDLPPPSPRSILGVFIMAAEMVLPLDTTDNVLPKTSFAWWSTRGGGAAVEVGAGIGACVTRYPR